MTRHPSTTTSIKTQTVCGPAGVDPSQLAVTQSVGTDTATQVVTGRGLTYFVNSDRGTVQRVNLTNLSAAGDPIKLNQKLEATRNVPRVWRA